MNHYTETSKIKVRSTIVKKQIDNKFIFDQNVEKNKSERFKNIKIKK